MGLTSALNTSVSGLNLSSTEINVLGNNVANAGTTGFKQSNVAFATQLARTISLGAPITSLNAGTNPRQVGMGGVVAAITPDFNQGSIAPGNGPSDLAIQGNGLFVLKNSSGAQVYTRDGTFGLDAANNLVSGNGQQVMGYGVDGNFNLVTTGLTPLQIPLNTLQVAQQTKNIQMSGALSPMGQIATQGTLQTSVALDDMSNPAGVAASGTLLTNLSQATSPTMPLFAVGQTIDLAPTQGGVQSPSATSLKVTSTTTVSDLEAFISNTLGLQTGGNVPVDADNVPVGVSINSSGQLVVKGNRGTVNDFSLPIGSMTVAGNAVPIAFTPGANAANGESATTAFTIYDSLGTPLKVQMSAYLESQGPDRTTYRYTLKSADQNGQPISIGTGTIDFDNLGRVSSPPTAQFTIDRSSTSAVNPMVFTLDVSQISGISKSSNLVLANQDGSSLGTLTSYVIDDKGVINGTFDNGIVRTLGQVTTAQFTNPQGLIQSGDNNFSQGLNSGPARIAAPGTAGSGPLRAGFLEQSNADLGKNLVDLISASAAYQGNARVINSNEQFFNELLSLRK